MGEAESGLESEGHMGGCERKGSRSASRSRGSSELARGVLQSSRMWGRSVCGHTYEWGGPGSQQEGSLDTGEGVTWRLLCWICDAPAGFPVICGW